MQATGHGHGAVFLGREGRGYGARGRGEDAGGGRMAAIVKGVARGLRSDRGSDAGDGLVGYGSHVLERKGLTWSVTHVKGAPSDRAGRRKEVEFEGSRMTSADQEEGARRMTQGTGEGGFWVETATGLSCATKRSDMRRAERGSCWRCCALDRQHQV